MQKSSQKQENLCRKTGKYISNQLIKKRLEPFKKAFNKKQGTMLESTQKVAENQAKEYAKNVRSKYAMKHARKVQGTQQKVCKKGCQELVKNVCKRSSNDLIENACKKQEVFNQSDKRLARKGYKKSSEELGKKHIRKLAWMQRKSMPVKYQTTRQPIKQ